MDELEVVAKAIYDNMCLANPHVATTWEGLQWDLQSYYTEQARAAITALDAFRAAEKRKNCKHHNRHGTGSVSSNGAGSYRWHCAECGSSGGYDLPETSAVS